MPGKVKITVIRQIQKRICLRNPMVMNLYLVLIGQSIGHMDIHRPWESLIAVRTMERQTYMAFVRFFHHPHPFIIIRCPAMERVLVIILRKHIGLPIQLKRTAADTVCHTSYRCAEIQCPCLISIHIVITKDNIHKVPSLIRNQDFHQYCAII